MDFFIIYNINDWINDKQQRSRYSLISRAYSQSNANLDSLTISLTKLNSL